MLIILIIFIMLMVVSFIILASDALGGDEGGEASRQTHAPQSCPCWSGCLSQMVALEDLSSLNILTIPPFKYHLRVQQ